MEYCEEHEGPTFECDDEPHYGPIQYAVEIDIKSVVEQVCQDYGISIPRVIIRSLRNDVKDSGRYFPKKNIIYLHHRKNGTQEEHLASTLHELGHYIDHIYNGRPRGSHDFMHTLICESLYRSYGVSSEMAMFVEEIYPRYWNKPGW